MQGNYWDDVGGARWAPSGTARTYYVRAEEVVWDYAPQGKNVLHDRPFSEEESVFVEVGSYFTSLGAVTMTSQFMRIATSLERLCFVLMGRAQRRR